MELKFVDPRALKENPDKARRSKSSPQADALLLATIKVVGIVQPPVVAPETEGGNGFVIDAGHRRVKQAIAAGLVSRLRDLSRHGGRKCGPVRQNPASADSLASS